MLYSMRSKDNALHYLIRDFLAGKHGLTGIEIGSYAGESAEMFLYSDAFDKLYCIDPWQMGYDPNDTTSGDGLPLAEQEFDKRFKGSPTVVKVKKFSNDAISMFADNSIDFLYIDGDHRYEFVKQDLQNYVPKVKLGGIISGHDYGWGGKEGVNRAVDEFFKEKPLKNYADNSWVFLKKQ